METPARFEIHVHYGDLENGDWLRPQLAVNRVELAIILSKIIYQNIPFNHIAVFDLTEVLDTEPEQICREVE